MKDDNIATKTLCVIPARGGSKRIPRKNIKNFCGTAMIARSIQTAQKSRLFDRIIVSTDDDQIAEVATLSGADVPFIRPEHLSNDYAGTIEVIAHAAQIIKEKDGVHYDYICCLYATAPFVTADNLHEAHKLIQTNHYDFTIPVTTFPFPIQRAVHLTDNGFLEAFSAENMTKRSQDLEEAYHDAGQFYFGTYDAWINTKNIWSQKIAPVFLPRYLVQDIDTQEDWIRAELMYKVLYPDVVCL